MLSSGGSFLFLGRPLPILFHKTIFFARMDEFKLCSSKKALMKKKHKHLMLITGVRE